MTDAQDAANSLPSLLAVRLVKQAHELQGHLASAGLRDKVQQLIALQHTVRKLGVALGVNEGFSPGSAQKRIQGYFVRNRGVIIRGDELGIVAGISTYARRVRELRKSQGMNILAGPAIDPATGHKLRPDEYLYPEEA